ncbi:MAG: hypothetical protein U0894_03810 [Pirellulales bacterium]
MYFSGGGTLKGVSRPGEIVGHGKPVENDKLKMDLDGRKWLRFLRMRRSAADAQRRNGRSCMP